MRVPVAIAILLGSAATAPAATFEVSGTADLIAAIEASEATAASDTIEMKEGIYEVGSIDDDPVTGFFGPTAFPSIRRSLVIEGSGSTIRRAAGAPSMRFFFVTGGSLTLRNLTVEGGGGSFPGETFQGGAISADDGFLNLYNCTFRDNSVTAATTNGGAIAWLFDSSFITLYIDGCRFEGNSATATEDTCLGGAIAGLNGTRIARSEFVGNSATGTFLSVGPLGNLLGGGFGGGVAIGFTGAPGSTPQISESLFEGNMVAATGVGTHALGGGIYATVGLILNCTISGNTATSPSGIAGGGGLFGFPFPIVRNLTIAGNRATTVSGSALGGGVYSEDLLAVGFGGGLVMDNSLLASNLPRNIDTTADASITSLGYNLSNDASGALWLVPEDLVNVNPFLGPLTDNGGPTRTHAIPKFSPAVDAASPTVILTVDQRGRDRPFDGDGDGTPIADIGAFEWHPPPNAAGHWTLYP